MYAHRQLLQDSLDTLKLLRLESHDRVGILLHPPTSAENDPSSQYRPTSWIVATTTTTYVDSGEALDVGAHSHEEAIDELLCHRRKFSALEKRSFPKPPKLQGDNGAKPGPRKGYILAISSTVYAGMRD